MKRFIEKVIHFLSFLIFPHIVLITSLGRERLIPPGATTLLAALSILFYIAALFYITPDKMGLSLRYKIMMGGRAIYLSSIISSLFQLPICFFIFVKYSPQLSTTLCVIDTVVAYLLLSFFQFLGTLRIFFTSRRLGLSSRVRFFALGWIPLYNLIFSLHFCKVVKKEYVYNYLKEEFERTRASDKVCQTRYPILLLHGFGFRDGKYLFNYWGRIPKALKKNGAAVYHGNQQANASIEDNAQEVFAAIDNILEKEGCERVNIIAHSKGGLDSRYLISSLGSAQKVASLTTISTPHRGSEIVTTLKKLPDKRFRKLCSRIDKTFRKLGDANPNTYLAAHQLSPAFMEQFNRDNPDSDYVYYQSFNTKIKKPLAIHILSLPHLLMKYLADDNDGLVSVESAKWGNYRGVLKSSHKGGLSHLEQIDMLQREYEGVDVQEDFVQIVKELKEMSL